MVSVCLPSDALLQYLSFLYGFLLPCIWGTSSRLLQEEQPLVLILDERYLLMATPPDLQGGLAPLSPPVPMQPLLLGRGVALLNPCTFFFFLIPALLNLSPISLPILPL